MRLLEVRAQNRERTMIHNLVKEGRILKQCLVLGSALETNC